jgi:hypothetical protein
MIKGSIVTMTINEAVIFSLPLAMLLLGVLEGRGENGSVEGAKSGASLGVKPPSGVEEGDAEGVPVGVSDTGVALGLEVEGVPA